MGNSRLALRMAARTRSRLSRTAEALVRIAEALKPTQEDE